MASLSHPSHQDLDELLKLQLHPRHIKANGSVRPLSKDDLQHALSKLPGEAVSSSSSSSSSVEVSGGQLIISAPRSGDVEDELTLPLLLAEVHDVRVGKLPAVVIRIAASTEEAANGRKNLQPENTFWLAMVSAEGNGVDWPCEVLLRNTLSWLGQQGAVRRDFGDLFITGDMPVSSNPDVYCAVEFHGQRRYAAKFLKATEKERMQREVAVLVAAQEHPNVQRFHGLYSLGEASMEESLSLPRWCLLTEFHRPYTVVDAIAVRSFSEPQASSVLRDLAGALQHIHSQRIVHKAVCAENVLLLESGAAVLVDFSESCFVSDHAELARPSNASPEYIAPEQQLRLPCTQKVDIYGAGVVLSLLLYKQYPSSAEGIGTLNPANFNSAGEIDRRGRRCGEVSAAGRALLKRLLAGTPEQRPSASMLLRDHWLQDKRHAPETLLMCSELPVSNHKLAGMDGADFGVEWPHMLVSKSRQENIAEDLPPQRLPASLVAKLARRVDVGHSSVINAMVSTARRLPTVPWKGVSPSPAAAKRTASPAVAKTLSLSATLKGNFEDRVRRAASLRGDESPRTSRQYRRSLST